MLVPIVVMESRVSMIAMSSWIALHGIERDRWPSTCMTFTDGRKQETSSTPHHRRTCERASEHGGRHANAAAWASGRSNADERAQLRRASVAARATRFASTQCDRLSSAEARGGGTGGIRGTRSGRAQGGPVASAEAQTSTQGSRLTSVEARSGARGRPPCEGGGVGERCTRRPWESLAGKRVWMRVKRR